MNLQLIRDQTLRLFQKLHQDTYEGFYRSNGSMYCEICGLQYRQHYTEQLYNIDKRLCNGDTVHL